MTETMPKAMTETTRDIMIDEVFPHAPATVWKTLTDRALIARWLMPAAGFAAFEGTEFTYQTRAAGEWDGTIRCKVLEVVPDRRLAYSWKGGHPSNVGYGAPLDTVVTWTLTPTDAGTRVQMVHSGFVLPRNETAYTGMGEGWKKVVKQLDDLTAEQSIQH